MDAPTILAAVALAGFGLNFLLSIRSGAWGLSDRLATMEQRIMEAMATDRNMVSKDVRAVQTRVEIAEKNFGETGLAIRTKIHELETWARDEFVRRKSFETVLTRMEAAQAERDKRLERWLEKMDEKIEQLQRQPH